jgi:hypothetical protein
MDHFALLLHGPFRLAALDESLEDAAIAVG